MEQYAALYHQTMDGGFKSRKFLLVLWTQVLLTCVSLRFGEASFGDLCMANITLCAAYIGVNGWSKIAVAKSLTPKGKTPSGAPPKPPKDEELAPPPKD